MHNVLAVKVHMQMDSLITMLHYHYQVIKIDWLKLINIISFEMTALLVRTFTPRWPRTCALLIIQQGEKRMLKHE